MSDLLFCIQLADDTSVFFKGTAYSSIVKDMNTELEKVDKWLKSQAFPRLPFVTQCLTQVATIDVHRTVMASYLLNLI